jgi:hypothetical protein
VLDGVVAGDELRGELIRRLAYARTKDRTPISKRRSVIPV